MNGFDVKSEILMVSTSLDGKGGIASVLTTYMNGGLSNNFNIRMLITHGGETNFKKISIFVTSILQMPGILFSNKYKVFHIHTSSRFSFLRKSIISWLGLLFGKKVILHLHGSEFMQFYNDECSQFTKWYISKTFSSVDRVIVLSSQWKDNILTIADKAKIDVIFNPIQVNKNQKITRNKNILLFLGRIGERKGFWDILNALALVKQSHDDFILKYGGDGELEKANAIIKELSLERYTEYQGWVSGKGKQDLINQSLIYLLPSYNEGLPMVILEAMASQLPVISCPIGGIPDAIFNDVNGLLVQPGDVVALSEAIIKLLDSEDLRKRLTSSALNDVNNKFSVDIIVPQIEALYIKLLES